MRSLLEIRRWMKPKKNPNVAEKLGGIPLLFDMTGGRLYELNETAELLWSLCDGKHTVDDMMIKMKEQYDVSADRVKEDVVSFLRKLQELNLVEMVV